MSLSNKMYHAIRNIKFGVINRIVSLLFQFILRTVILYNLGVEYLGIGSLFLSVLNMLNLAELGFSDAMVFFLYKPIAENNAKQICALLNLYKKIYRVIGTVILSMGIILVPFLPRFIHGAVPEKINLYIVYILYLLNNVVGYFFYSYKSALIEAHQRNDLINKMQTIITIIRSVLQIIVLLIWRNYYIYTILFILCMIFNNLIIEYCSRKYYSQYICCGKISPEIKRDMKKRIKGLMISRVCNVSRNSFDSIVISALLGLEAVAVYDNYFYIIKTIESFLFIITTGISAGIGDSIARKSIKENYCDMKYFSFIYAWISCFCTVCLVCLYQPFMKLWVGGGLLLPTHIMICFCTYFYALRIGDIRSLYVTGAGLWWEERYRSIIEAALNIILNIVLGKMLGLLGIILGTLLSLFLLNILYGSGIVFKYYFNKKWLHEYFKMHLRYAFVTFILCAISYMICSKIACQRNIKIILQFLIAVMVGNAGFGIIYRHSEYMNKLKCDLNNMLHI